MDRTWRPKLMSQAEYAEQRARLEAVILTALELRHAGQVFLAVQADMARLGLQLRGGA